MSLSVCLASDYTQKHLIYTYVHDRTRLVSSIVIQTQIVTQTRSKKDKDEERDVEEDDDDNENHEGEKKENGGSRYMKELIMKTLYFVYY